MPVTRTKTTTRTTGTEKTPVGKRTKARAAVPAASPASRFMKDTKGYGVTQTDVVRMTGFSTRTVGGWAKGAAVMGPARKAVAETSRILHALGTLMEPENVGPWLKEPNPAFDGSTPLQVIERGEADRIWRMIHHLESGEPG